MGSSYMTLVGAPPSPLTLQFFKWINDLVAARIAECPLVRTTTYYFSQSGNDSTGDGSQGNPWKTIAKAQAIHDAAATNADIRLRFKRGDEWNEAAGLDITKNNATIDDYGTGVKPLFNRFIQKYNSSGWTLASGDRYTRSETNTIAWLRDQADRLYPYTKVSSTAEVESTSRSFYWASNVLHINAGSGVNPNTKNLEAVENNSDCGVELSGDGGRCQNIRADGWGMDTTSTNNQRHGFKISGNGTKSNLMKGCEAHYNSAHCIAYNGSNGLSGDAPGGYATFIDCKTGFPWQNSSGETHFNSYVAGGNQEVIFHNCETKYGTLPQGTGAYVARGTSVYQHTGGGGAVSALYLVYGHRTPLSNYPVNVGVYGANTTVATALSGCRAFNVFERIEFPPQSSTSSNSAQYIAADYIANINCMWQVRPIDLNPTPRALATAIDQKGWMINCILDVDMVNQTASMAIWNHNADNNTMKIWNSMFYIRGNGTVAFLSLDFDSTPNCSGAEMKNTIICLLNPGATSNVGFNGDSTKMVSNAYTVDTLTDGSGTKRYSVDATRVELGSQDIFYPQRTYLTSEHPLYQKGTSLNLGYDINLNLRGPTPSIGPYDSYKTLDLGRVTALVAAIASSTSITLSWTAASGLVNITDHEVKYRVVGTTSWTTFSHSLNPGNSITVTGLTAKTEYEFSVAPVSAWGTGNPEFVKATPYAGSDLRRVTVYPKVGT